MGRRKEREVDEGRLQEMLDVIDYEEEEMFSLEDLLAAFRESTLMMRLPEVRRRLVSEGEEMYTLGAFIDLILKDLQSEKSTMERGMGWLFSQQQEALTVAGLLSWGEECRLDPPLTKKEAEQMLKSISGRCEVRRQDLASWLRG